MFNKKIQTVVMGSVVALALALAGTSLAAFTADEAAELSAEAKATAEKFKAETKGADAIFAKAKGVLVCPKITKFGIGIGTEGGKCVLTDGGAEPLYYNTRALKAGALLGVQKHSMILVMNTDEAMANFTSGKREWEFGVDASVSIAKIGAGGDIDTTNLKGSIISFIFGEKGLMADLSWEGSSFKKLDVETK
jgi:lipid-binding SYLF domain-containing protein